MQIIGMKKFINMLNLKYKLQLLFNEGLIKLPDNIISWIDNNIENIKNYYIKNTNINKDEYSLFDQIEFVNPYTNETQKINIYITQNEKFPHIALYSNNEKSIIIKNLNVTPLQLKSVLLHEFTHAVDPKNNKGKELSDKSDLFNGKKDNFLSPKEIDAYLQSIIFTFGQLLPNDDYLLFKLKNYIFKSETFPFLPSFPNYSRVVNSLDNKLKIKFKKLLVKTFNSLLNKKLDFE